MKEFGNDKYNKFLVIDCASSLIIIDLDKCLSIQDLINELEGFYNQKILRIGFANSRLSNW